MKPIKPLKLVRRHQYVEAVEFTKEIANNYDEWPEKFRAALPNFTYDRGVYSFQITDGEDVFDKVYIDIGDYIVFYDSGSVGVMDRDTLDALYEVLSTGEY